MGMIFLKIKIPGPKILKSDPDYVIMLGFFEKKKKKY